MHTADWCCRIEVARDQAIQALEAGDLEQATSLINEGFAIVDREGDESDPTFARFLCAAGAVAMYVGEIDAGAALYRRAHDIARPLGSLATVTLFAALRGLALADGLRGWSGRAVERFSEARAQRSVHETRNHQ